MYVPLFQLSCSRYPGQVPETTRLRITPKVAGRLHIPGDNSPLRQQFTTGAKGISQQVICNY
jgi:hypothetical protein